MANTIPDIPVPTDEYVNINTLSGFSVGTALIVTNKSTEWGLMQIASTKPTDDSFSGEPICSLPSPTAIKFVGAGEGTVWVKATGNTPIKLSVQDNS